MNLLDLLQILSETLKDKSETEKKMILMVLKSFTEGYQSGLKEENK